MGYSDSEACQLPLYHGILKKAWHIRFSKTVKVIQIKVDAKCSPSRRKMNWDSSGKQRGGEFEGWGE
jgi:hypothetical protein